MLNGSADSSRVEMAVSAPLSAELAELNELFNEMDEEEETGMFESLGLSFGCCDGRTSDDNVAFTAEDSSTLQSPLQSSDEQNNEDEEAVMNFFDDCYCIDGPMIGMDYDLPEDEVNQGAGSEAEMAALDGVPILVPLLPSPLLALVIQQEFAPLPLALLALYICLCLR